MLSAPSDRRSLHQFGLELIWPWRNPPCELLGINSHLSLHKALPELFKDNKYASHLDVN